MCVLTWNVQLPSSIIHSSFLLISRIISRRFTLTQGYSLILTLASSPAFLFTDLKHPPCPLQPRGPSSRALCLKAEKNMKIMRQAGIILQLCADAEVGESFLQDD